MQLSSRLIISAVCVCEPVALCAGQGRALYFQILQSKRLRDAEGNITKDVVLLIKGNMKFLHITKWFWLSVDDFSFFYENL